MKADLPFIAKYAKTGKTACKSCNQNIEKDTLRFGIMVQSPHFDGKVPLWHHIHCFFKTKTTIKTGDIANFDNLRWEDQEKLKKALEGRKNGLNDDFSVEYAKSSLAICKGCKEKIGRGVIRISKIDRYRPEIQRFGPAPAWHVDCFVKDRLNLEFFDSVERLLGFNTLSDEDKEMVKENIPSIGEKRKADASESNSSQPKKSIRKEDKLLKLQNQFLYDMRDSIKREFSKMDMIELLEYNEQYIPKAESRLLDNLSDCLLFGALKTCPVCKNAKLRFKLDSYYCPGNLTEWTKCQYESKFPEREEFLIPEKFRENFDFLSLPLDGFKVFLIGKMKHPHNITQKIQELGATVVSTFDCSVQLCVSTKEEVLKGSENIIKALTLDVHVVSDAFLDSLKQGSSVAFSIKENMVAYWGGDPVLKFGVKKENKLKSFKVDEELEEIFKSSPKKMKVTVGSAAAVDPDSGLENIAHVYQDKDNIYNAVLGAVDVLKGSNSYYKLQVLKSNKSSKYWLFRSWGRVGTTIGDYELEQKSDIADAIFQFEDLYYEKTGNFWWDRNNFEKKPNRMYPLEICYNQVSEHVKQLKPGHNSKLDKSIQELICLIFDIRIMKKAMNKFEIDLKKMPLGKLSKNQIELAFNALIEAQEVINNGSNSAKIIDVSNRFYTLIPHNFGIKKPTLLDDEEYIKSKFEMLDSLLEIEFAYSLLTNEDEPIDKYYKKLKTDIEVLDIATEEYKNIETYFKNTQHDIGNLKLNKVFKISRHGEFEKYKKELHNKKLLWHGSSVTNFVGILSQGLRLPSYGGMFGAGIYFADMVSKSADYCDTSETGLLLLCEVALGNMYECIHAENIKKLPVGKHSTKGLGEYIPRPSQKAIVGDVEIPYGKPVRSRSNFGLFRNEYIVYNTKQVNIKYLLSVDFSRVY